MKIIQLLMFLFGAHLDAVIMSFVMLSSRVQFLCLSRILGWGVILFNCFFQYSQKAKTNPTDITSWVRSRIWVLMRDLWSEFIYGYQRFRIRQILYCKPPFIGCVFLLWFYLSLMYSQALEFGLSFILSSVIFGIPVFCY